MRSEMDAVAMRVCSQLENREQGKCVGSIRKMNQRTSWATLRDTSYSPQKSRMFFVRLLPAAFSLLARGASSSTPRLIVKNAIHRPACIFSLSNNAVIEWSHMALGAKPKEFCWDPQQGN